MCQACLRSKPLRFTPSQIYNNTSKRVQSRAEHHQAGDLHLELWFTFSSHKNTLNDGTEYITSAEILQLTRLCLLLACTSDRTRGPCSEWDGLSTTVKRRCGGRERSKDQPTDEENPSWTGARPLRPSGPSSKATISDQTLQTRGCESLLNSTLGFQE